MLSKSEYTIQANVDKNILDANNIKYEMKEGVYQIETDDLADIIHIIPADNILKIEKNDLSLEQLLKKEIFDK